jgi:hypothetical protein
MVLQGDICIKELKTVLIVVNQSRNPALSEIKCGAQPFILETAEGAG